MTSSLFCLQDSLPGPGQGAAGGDNTFVMLAVLWAVLALALFLIRPDALRSDRKAAPRGGGHGDNDRDEPRSDQPPPSVF